MKKYIVLSLITAALLTGCGGGGGTTPTTTPTPDGNILPVVDAGDNRTITENTDTTMTGIASDADGTIVSYEWKENGNVLSTEDIFIYTGTGIGLHTLVLTVTDDENGITTDSVVITVEAEAPSTFIPYDAPAISQSTITEYLDAVNAARAQVQDCGTYGIFQPAPPVTWSDELYRASSEHSYDLAILGETSIDIQHDGTGTASDWTAQVLDLGRGSTPWERGENNGYTNNVRWATGENVHASPTNITVAMEDWMESDGHCSTVMNPNSLEVGVAMVENQNAAWTYYWTQLFGGPRG